MVGGDGDRHRRLRPARLAGVLARRAAPTTARAGENDLIGADIENIEAAADVDAQTVTITGDGRAQPPDACTGGKGDDHRRRGLGHPRGRPAGRHDQLARRLARQRRSATAAPTPCSPTRSTRSRRAARTCRSQATPGGPFDDRPPTLAWTAPGAGASLTANGATTLLRQRQPTTAGSRKVQFFDDDRLVCEDTAAPYTCAYQPRGGDVGRNTLIAVATDGASQTTSVRARRSRSAASPREARDALAAAEPRPPRARTPSALSGPRHRARTPSRPRRAARARSPSPPSAARRSSRRKRVAAVAHVRVLGDVQVPHAHRRAA